MKIVVCIRQGRDGEINPFDACAYEEALKIKNAEITLLSMGPKYVESFLLSLTRLGAANAILLSDSAFAGADTLATAYTLSSIIKNLNPDLVFCGRQTLEGDTGQTGPMMSVMLKFSLITNVMRIVSACDNKIICETRDEGVKQKKLPALITVERINNLRLPSIRSKIGKVEVLDALAIGVDLNKCGLRGSPTRVLSTYENESGKRKVKFIAPKELDNVIQEGLKKNLSKISPSNISNKKLKNVFAVGEKTYSFAKMVSDDITLITECNEEYIIRHILEENPPVVLWGSDSKSKRTAARVAAKLNLGLCADCVQLETDGEEMFMYRPALSGKIIAKIKSLTVPAMATVRTCEKNSSDIAVAAGFGVKDSIDKVKRFADSINAQLVASRKTVDNGYMPYDCQVGLTGKTISPPIYIAIGISGAVHHIVGMQSAGTVIAINPDKNAPIFDYADYGIIADFEDVF